VPPEIVNVTGAMLAELTTLTIFGVMTRGFGPVMLRDAATVVPTLSLTVNDTVVAAVLGGTVTTKVPPLELTLQVEISVGSLQLPLGVVVSLHAAARFADVTV